jgi:tetratricopeptide (TPR) repeat protein
MAHRIPSFNRARSAVVVLVALACSAGAQTDELSRAHAMLVEANRLIDNGDLDAGAHRAADALAIYEAMSADNATAVQGRGDANYLLGRAFHRAQQDEGALQYWKRSVGHYQRLTGRPASKNLLAVLEDMLPLLLNAGRTDDALTVMAAIPQLMAEIGDPAASQAEAHSNLGVMLMRVGRLLEAQHELEQAVDLSQREGGSPAASQSNYLYNLGLVRNELKYPAALQNFRDALALLGPLPGSGVRRAEIMLDMSLCLKTQGKPEEARRELETALQLVGNDPAAQLLKAKLLVNLANDTYGRLGRKREAVGRYREALQLTAGRKGTDEIEAAATINIANYLSETGGVEEAIGMYRQALAKLEASPTPKGSASTLHKNLGLLLLKAGRSTEAQQSLLAALRIQWTSLAADLPALTSRQKQLAIDELAPLTSAIYASAFAKPSGGSAAYEAALRMKAIFSEASRVERLGLGSSVPAATASKYARYLELRHEISRRILQPISSDEGDEKTRLAAEAQQLEVELKADPNVFRAEARLTPTTIADVTARLSPGDLLLEYVAYQSVDPATLRMTGMRYGVFAVEGGTGKIVALDLGEQAVLDEVIAAFRDRQSAQADPVAGKLDEDELARLALAVRTRVLDPVLKGMATPKRIYIAPDGIIGLVPFEVLPARRSTAGWRYLVEDTEFLYLLTGRDVARHGARHAQSGKEVWLVGDPAYEATPEQRIAAANAPPASTMAPTSLTKHEARTLVAGVDRPAGEGVPTDWIRLDGTRAILAGAAQAARNAGLLPRILVDAGASEEKVYAIHSPRALLFATHGFFMASPPTVSFSFKDDGVKGGTVNADFFEAADPLQRSMLILAGANRRDHSVIQYAAGDRLVSAAEAKRLGMPPEQMDLARRELGDGLLTAYKVMGMDLAGTQLILLLACESGLGSTTVGQSAPGLRQAQGESVAGLRQAFFIAGAESLTMSLWPVPLEDTSTQMQSFLDGWLARGLPRYKAFHAAQLAGLARARQRTGGGHPFWWGGFVYLGNPGDL